MYVVKQFFTARKRSLGQGNVFTPVCHSVHGGRAGLHPGGRVSAFWGVGVGVGHTPLMGYGQRAGGTHPTGMHPFGFEIFEIRQIFLAVHNQPTNKQTHRPRSEKISHFTLF